MLLCRKVIDTEVPAEDVLGTWQIARPIISLFEGCLIVLFIVLRKVTQFPSIITIFVSLFRIL